MEKKYELRQSTKNQPSGKLLKIQLNLFSIYKLFNAISNFV